jgi:hypothetical protein
MNRPPDHPRERTGVRLVLTNSADPSRTADYSAWYDDYERGIIRPGLIANALRFENPDAAGTDIDPHYAALYDIVSRNPASAWPAVASSSDYPTYLFDDPRSRLVLPTLRASYALTESVETDEHGKLTGVHIILSDGGTDELRARRAAALVETGFFYLASRFSVIEGSPEPPAILEVFETDRLDPLAAYSQARSALRLQAVVDGAHERSHSFMLVAAHWAGSEIETSSGVEPLGRDARKGA